MVKQKHKTFSNLQVIKSAQETVQLQLGEKYSEVVSPFRTIIEMVMKARNIDQFTAMKIIKDEFPIYNKVDAPLMFSAALMDIVEDKHFVGFKN